MTVYKKLTISIITILLYYTNSYSNLITIQAQDSTIYKSEYYIQRGYRISVQNQDKAYKHFQDGAKYYLQKKDTINYLDCMLGLSEIEKRNGKFNRSFDILWEILPIAKVSTNKKSLVQVHRKLGLMYGLYGKDSLSIRHLKEGIKFDKEKSKNDDLVGSYFAVAEQYLDFNNYDDALKYLDSCYLVTASNKRLIYVDALYGYIYTKKDNSRKANIYFKNLIPTFEDRKLAYLARIYSFQADLKSHLNEKDSAIFYLKKSLKVIDTMQVHIEIKPAVLEKLANLHFEKNKKSKAFEYLRASKTISDSLFHTQSVHNKELFEIKTKYQEDLSKKEKQIIAQNKVLKSKEKASFRLKIALGILTFIVTIFLLIYRIRWQTKQMAYNKEKNEAILEIKNKELTENALQIIEKEQTVNELMEIVKDSLPEKHKILNNTFKQRNKKIWDNFHLRFTQTNNKFYQQLLKLHPTLTPNDLKICALIKLNFDSKEMAQILGISLHSIHMARSRVRKKLNLIREDSLSKYLSSIV